MQNKLGTIVENQNFFKVIEFKLETFSDCFLCHPRKKFIFGLNCLCLCIIMRERKNPTLEYRGSYDHNGIQLIDDWVHLKKYLI